MQEAEILRDFDPITLGEMDNVKLMNRTDTKFTFPFSRFSDLMAELKEFYRVLEINGERMCRYETLYYDTENLDLYYQHHRGKLNRYKIRHRTYVNTGTGFLEVKFKNNKGRTIKSRIEQQKVSNGWQEPSRIFLEKSLPLEPQLLLPVIWINYFRYTLVNKTGGERVTLDLGLEFVKDEKCENLGKLVIAEAKQDKRIHSPFSELMKKYHIPEGSVSKYCMGVAFTSPEVKVNNFKMRLNRIKKMNQ